VQREEREMIYSKRVRAGKRTYFFDVRSTRSNDYYLTVTESRRQQKEGDFTYEKSKMFIYKEDFNKFVDALQETVNHIKTELLPDFDFDQYSREEDENSDDTENVRNNSSSGETFSETDLKWE
jgi:hypothetical protein